MTTDLKLFLGQRLKSARQAACLSQEHAADTLRVSRQVVSKWERGLSCPTAIQLGDLAILYCACAHSLLFGQPFEQVQFNEFLKKQRLTQPLFERMKNGERCDADSRTNRELPGQTADSSVRH